MDYWIDTHAHVYSEEFRTDIADIIARSNENHVSTILMPNVDTTSIDAMLEVESRYPGCHAMMGLHPCSVKKDFERELYIVEEWLSRRPFTAVGEIGTDLYWDKTFWDHQCEAFRIQVDWAKKFKIPVVIHCRESLDKTIDMVERFQDGNLAGVFHCFTGTAEQAERIARLNFYIGIGGVATFKNAGLDKVLPEVPLDRIVLETDSPYLAPVPHRGKRNDPSYIPLIAQRVADVMNVTLDEIRAKTTVNARALFQMDKPTFGK